MLRATNLMRELGEKIDAVVDAVSAKDQEKKTEHWRRIDEVKTAYSTLEGALAVDLGECDELVEAARGKWTEVKEILGAIEPPELTPKAWKTDGSYLILAVLLTVSGILAVTSANAWLGWLTVGVVDLVLIRFLFVAGFRSDRTYRWNWAAWLRRRNLLPSRLAALVVVPVFLLAIVLGFGGIYAEVACMDGLDALYHSGLTIATLGYIPGAGTDAAIAATEVLVIKKVMLVELWSGILGIVTILALLINRISVF